MIGSTREFRVLKIVGILLFAERDQLKESTVQQPIRWIGRDHGNQSSLRRH